MLKSTILFDKTVVTAYGDITFDSNGVAKDLTLSAEQQKAMARVPYLFYVEEKKLSPKPKPVVEPEPTPEPKAEPKKATRTRKTTKATEK